MDKGLHIISHLQARWRRQGIAINVLRALAISVVATAVVHIAWHWSLWAVLPVWILCTVVFCFLFPWWRLSAKDVAVWIDRHCPEMEESTGLLLQSPETLQGLAALQAAKVSAILPQLSVPEPLKKEWRSAWLIALGSLLLVGFAEYVAFRLAQQPVVENQVSQTLAGVEEKLPEIGDVRIGINPPAYTGVSKRTQNSFNLKVEEGAVVHWELQTTSPVTAVTLLINDSLTCALKPTDSTHTQWEYTRTIQQPGFYQVKLNGQLSALYKLEVIKDQSPVIQIQSPKSYTLIEYGQPPQVQVQAALSDDYGLQGAALFVTIANGSGEAVKFKEEKFVLPVPPGARQYNAGKLLSLRSFDMHPGDELYFYLSTQDALHHETHSDRYMVVWQDTAQLMQLDGMVNGVDLKPVFFRSERQIIIEATQLLRDKDTISLKAFQEKSNDLGADQKLLRLRYGQFLGEEAESGEEGRQALNNLDNAADFSNAAKILDAVTDKHDNAEDATFLDPKTKEQLKATLTEMWNAELRLRVYKPEEALPYAYKALRMLKDLQQQSRAYVAKTGVKTTPLKPEKRLTGELDKIGSPLTERNIRNATADTLFRQALGILEQWQEGGRPDVSQQALLQKAGLQLGTHAAADPGAYLPAVAALRRLLQSQANNAPVKADLLLAEHALQQLVPAPALQPYREVQVPDMNLSQQYFQRLGH